MTQAQIDTLTTEFIEGVLVCDNHQMSDDNLDTLLALLKEEKAVREWEKGIDLQNTYLAACFDKDGYVITVLKMTGMPTPLDMPKGTVRVEIAIPY